MFSMTVAATRMAITLLLIAFVERTPNADLSRVLWDAGPSSEVATPIWPPRSRGETNDIIAKPYAVHFFPVRVFVSFKCGFCGHLRCNLEAVSSQLSFQVFLTGYHETKRYHC